MKKLFDGTVALDVIVSAKAVGASSLAVCVAEIQNAARMSVQLGAVKGCVALSRVPKIRILSLLAARRYIFAILPLSEEAAAESHIAAQRFSCGSRNRAGTGCHVFKIVDAPVAAPAEPGGDESLL